MTSVNHLHPLRGYRGIFRPKSSPSFQGSHPDTTTTDTGLSWKCNIIRMRCYLVTCSYIFPYICHKCVHRCQLSMTALICSGDSSFDLQLSLHWYPSTEAVILSRVNPRKPIPGFLKGNIPEFIWEPMECLVSRWRGFTGEIFSLRGAPHFFPLLSLYCSAMKVIFSFIPIVWWDNFESWSNMMGAVTISMHNRSGLYGSHMMRAVAIHAPLTKCIVPISPLPGMARSYLTKKAHSWASSAWPYTSVEKASRTSFLILISSLPQGPPSCCLTLFKDSRARHSPPPILMPISHLDHLLTNTWQIQPREAWTGFCFH